MSLKKNDKCRRECKSEEIRVFRIRMIYTKRLEKATNLAISNFDLLIFEVFQTDITKTAVSKRKKNLTTSSEKN